VLPRRAKVNLMTRHKRLTALFLSAFFVTATAGLPLAALAPMASAAPRSPLPAPRSPLPAPRSPLPAPQPSRPPRRTSRTSPSA
jgi:hypothetical protein